MPGSSLPLGVLGRAHGVRGEMVFRPYNPEGADLAELDLPLEVELRDKRPGAPAATTGRPARLLTARPFKDSAALVRFEGIDSPEAAAALTNCELCVPRDALPPLGEGEFYVADLIGCTVEDGAGNPRGVVQGCFWNGTQDILQIRDPAGQELLVPAVEDFLREVDLPRRRVVIEPQEEEEVEADHE